MPTPSPATLNEGAVSLAAANWSDATGGQEDAILSIPSGSQSITGGLDMSAVTNGMDRFDVLPQFTGRIGSPSAGPLKLRLSDGVTNRFNYNAGGGVLYLQAAGTGANTISNFWKSSPGAAYLMGGTFTDLILGEGPLSVNGSTVVDNAYLKGGNSTFEAGTGFKILNVYSGTHYIKRNFIASGSGGSETLNIFGGTVILDTTTTGNLSTVNVYRDGTLRLLSSDGIATLNLEGFADFSQAKVGITIATANLGPLYKINESANVTITTRAAAGAKALRG